MRHTTFNSTVFRRIIREVYKERERDIGTGLNIDSGRLIFVLFFNEWAHSGLRKLLDLFPGHITSKW